MFAIADDCRCVSVCVCTYVRHKLHQLSAVFTRTGLWVLCSHCSHERKLTFSRQTHSGHRLAFCVAMGYAFGSPRPTGGVELVTHNGCLLTVEPQ